VTQRCIIWHRHSPPGSWHYDKYRDMDLSNGVMDIEPWPEGQSFPERDNAYAYQVARGNLTNASQWWKPKHWEIEESDIGPMSYFGMPRFADGKRYCEDQNGQLHELAPGDTIEPVKKGQIVVTHYGQQDLEGDTDV
jgi:hypothetical protein